MPKKQTKPKKPTTELTTDEAMQKMFGKRITETAKKVAHEKDPPDTPESPHR